MWEHNHSWCSLDDILPGWLVLRSLCTSPVEAKCAPTGSSSDRSFLLTASLSLSLSFPEACFPRKPANSKEWLLKMFLHCKRTISLCLRESQCYKLEKKNWIFILRFIFFNLQRTEKMFLQSYSSYHGCTCGSIYNWPIITGFSTIIQPRSLIFPVYLIHQQKNNADKNEKLENAQIVTMDWHSDSKQIDKRNHSAEKANISI